MCGIYGTTISYSEEQIKSKLKRTAFRGPDQMGWETFKSRNAQITFGHNRLSIIDLDPRSNQPFTYAENIHIVFNGEIFNFQPLKEMLGKKGYAFNTTSDTEVICAAYLEYGQDCVSHFNGMFAFVIYDANKQILYGAKDRLGQKPFYYYLNGKDFEFASQISSIQLHHSNLSISEKSIEEYLTWNAVPPPNSIFNQVKKLEDGFCFTFNLDNQEFKTYQYWDIDHSANQLFTGSYQQAQEELEVLLKDAVKIRLFADVPVGVFLSGGVDSSLVAAMAKNSTEKKVKTFSVKFNEKGYDESNYAKQVAEHLQTDHHIIECDYEEGLDLIENFTEFYDEPFADSSAIPSMLLAKHTKNEVTVALTGDGADESFLGYPRYNWIKTNKNIYKIPQVLRNLAANVIAPMPYKNNRLKTFSQYLQLHSIEEAYIKSMTTTDITWLEFKTKRNNPKEFKYLFHNNKNIFERASDFDLKTYLTWDINTKVDRASMAYSLEARSPFLDYRVVEFAETLPTNFKLNDKTQKRILKDILYKHVPKEIFDRPKSGFGMPFKVWFRNDLKEYVLTELSEKNLKSIPGINPKIVLKIIEQHMDGSWGHPDLIWKLLVLKQWLDRNGSDFSVE